MLGRVGGNRDRNDLCDELRRHMESDEVLQVPGVHDTLTARIVDDVGFDVIFTSGYGASLSSLGLPDAGYIDQSEMIRFVRNITNVVSSPVLADFDTGFGNALNARRSVAELIKQTNAAGVMIEDQVAPKRCGFVAGKQVVPREEAVLKIKAVTDLREELDEDICVVARTDAHGAANADLEEAITRANLFYEEAGADMVFVEGLEEEDEIEAVGERVDAPIFYHPPPYLDLDRLQELGYSWVQQLVTLLPAMEGTRAFLEGWKDDYTYERTFRAEREDLPYEGLLPHGFAGFDEVANLEREYLPEESVREKYDSDSIGFRPDSVTEE